MDFITQIFSGHGAEVGIFIEWVAHFKTIQFAQYQFFKFIAAPNLMAGNAGILSHAPISTLDFSNSAARCMAFARSENGVSRQVRNPEGKTLDSRLRLQRLLIWECFVRIVCSHRCLDCRAFAFR